MRGSVPSIQMRAGRNGQILAEVECFLAEGASPVAGTDLTYAGVVVWSGSGLGCGGALAGG